MSFLIFSIIIWTVIFFLLIILSWVWPPDSPWSPWWKTSKEVAKDICKLANISKKDIVYELGSGDGEGLIAIAKTTGARVVGIEIDFIRFFQSLIAKKRSGIGSQITIYRKNFFAVDISSATIVYFYLVPRAIKRILPKLARELKPGTKIISYRYEVPGLKQIGFDKNNIIYLYEAGKRSQETARAKAKKSKSPNLGS